MDAINALKRRVELEMLGEKGMTGTVILPKREAYADPKKASSTVWAISGDPCSS